VLARPLHHWPQKGHAATMRSPGSRAAARGVLLPRAPARKATAPPLGPRLAAGESRQGLPRAAVHLARDPTFLCRTRSLGMDYRLPLTGDRGKRRRSGGGCRRSGDLGESGDAREQKQGSWIWRRLAMRRWGRELAVSAAGWEELMRGGGEWGLGFRVVYIYQCLLGWAFSCTRPYQYFGFLVNRAQEPN
jgi:hypothetical protein